MVTDRIKIILVVFTILFFIFLIHNIRKANMNKDMATIWIVWALGLIVLAIFPQVADFIASLLGIATTSNIIFIIMIFILYCLCFYLFIKYSKLENKLNNLIQKIGIEEAKKDDTK